MLFLVVFILPLAFANTVHERQDCPTIIYPDCATTDTVCWGGYDANYCALADFCMPMMSGVIGDDGNKCHTMCPQICNENEISCDMGSPNGCYQGNTCAAPAGDCPAICHNDCDWNAGEQMCDMGLDDNQCWMGNWCAAPNGDCPAICPTHCDWKADETLCDHPYDSNGCNMGGWCAPAGTECPVLCPVVDPVECAVSETVCWGGNDANGCVLPDNCMPMMSGGIGKDGAECHNTCPQICNENQISCENEYYNGCHQGNHCSDSYGDCPATCPSFCNHDAGEMGCWGGNDANGCALPDNCMLMMSGVIGEDGTECYTMCPQICNENEISCDMGSLNGCYQGNTCAAPDGDCPAICHKYCDWNAGEQMCDMGQDDNQCWLGNYCVPEGTECTQN